MFTSLNLEQNIALPLIEHARLSRAEAEELARMKLALTGLPPEAATKYPAELSGGMVKRAALARALALDPEILFLDEPTAALGVRESKMAMDLVRSLKDHGLSVIMITHNMQHVLNYCDRVMVLRLGRLAAVRDVQDVDGDTLVSLITGASEDNQDRAA